MNCHLCIVLTISLLNIAAAPATRPATRPAKVDLSSPDAAIQSYIDTIEQGDIAAYQRIAAPQTDDQRQALAHATAAHQAARRLVEVTRRQLGDEPAARVEELTGRMGLGPNKETADSLREAMEGSQWKFGGDDAVLGEVWPEVRFRRIDGQWRLLVPLEENGAELAERFKHMQQFTQMIEQIGQRVGAGELTTTEQIGQALAGLLPVATVKAATGPATTEGEQ
jgi:hypothetical protein